MSRCVLNVLFKNNFLIRAKIATVTLEIYLDCANKKNYWTDGLPKIFPKQIYCKIKLDHLTCYRLNPIFKRFIVVNFKNSVDDKRQQI